MKPLLALAVLLFTPTLAWAENTATIGSNIELNASVDSRLTAARKLIAAIYTPARRADEIKFMTSGLTYKQLNDSRDLQHTIGVVNISHLFGGNAKELSRIVDELTQRQVIAAMTLIQNNFDNYLDIKAKYYAESMDVTSIDNSAAFFGSTSGQSYLKAQEHLSADKILNSWVAELSAKFNQRTAEDIKWLTEETKPFMPKARKK